mmetsp:Transcript_53263/g.105883  ORF Transcript_53263/g.105883 Transcript_53263/m.105883 type:complete len:285 (+) Transcript_53263:64-918(+)
MASPPYVVEPAKSGRSTCKASKLPIAKDELRFGSAIDMGGHVTYAYRKLDYITAKIVENVKAKLDGGAEKVAGFDSLNRIQQAKLISAFQKAEKAGMKASVAKAKAVAAKAKAKAKALVAKDKLKAAKAKAKAKSLAAKAKSKAKSKSTSTAVSTAAPAPIKEASAIVTAGTNKRARSVSAETGPASGEKLAHQAIDLAKEAKWKKLFDFLGDHGDIVNVRPSMRVFGIIHQAAWHGSFMAVDHLVDEFTADLTLETKDGKTAADIAEQEGHVLLAKHIKKMMG